MGKTIPEFRSMENRKLLSEHKTSEAEQIFQEIIKPKRFNVLFNCEIKISKCPMSRIMDFNKELRNLMIKYQISLIGSAGFFIEPNFPNSEDGLGAKR